nr:zinc-finger domain-containing protein [Neobacillus sp. Marseille-Q6967]
MKNSNRKELLNHVESLMTQYCDGCLLHQSFKQENGRRFAHRFCITKCTVGEKLQEYGRKLT